MSAPSQFLTGPGLSASRSKWSEEKKGCSLSAILNQGLAHLCYQDHLGVLINPDPGVPHHSVSFSGSGVGSENPSF